MTSPERVYCLARCDDWGHVVGPRGFKRRYLLLTRRGLPWATGLEHPVSYDDCSGTRVWLDDQFLCEIDGGTIPYRPGDSRCWLYNDRTRVCHVAYRRRFAMLVGEMCEAHDFPWDVAYTSLSLRAEAR